MPGLVAGLTIALFAPTGVDAPPHWLGYIGTPDVDQTTARAEALGAKILMKPTDIPTVGKFSVMADPYGAVFAAFALVWMKALSQP